MRRLTAIVAANHEGVIGAGNALPWRIRSDMRFFRQQTTGNIVVMGRKTFDSMRRCLPDRHNIIISRRAGVADTPDCVWRTGVFAALVAAEAAAGDEIFVIGGAEIYRQFAGLVDRYLITVVDQAVPAGDAFFDMGVIGDRAGWDISEVAAGVADAAAGDAAGYRIIELTARDGEARRAARRAGMMQEPI